MKHYDVTVIDRGFAGSAAALASARTGAKTLLIEKINALGGAPSTMYINPFMYYTTRMPDGTDKWLCDGIFRELVDEMIKMGGSDGDIFEPEYLKLILNRKMSEAGVDLLFNSTLVSAKRTGNKVVSVDVVNKEGIMTVESDYFIDATGDADLTVAAGFPTRLGRPEDNLCQPMSLLFLICNVDEDRLWTEGRNYRKIWQEEMKKGYIKNPMENIMIHRTMHKGILNLNATRIIKRDPTNAHDLTLADIEAREQIFELLTFLRNFIPGCENADILASAPMTGVRESRMIDGEHILSTDELKACTVFPDTVACGNYDIDIHNPEGSGTSHYFFENGTYYKIPYRSLIPKDAENLLVAGRCISVSHEVQASIRIMPIVTTLGEAAGTAAAIASNTKKNVKDIDVKLLRTTLRNNGACID